MRAPQNYSSLQITLHWLIAGLILIQLTINADMQQAFAARLWAGTLPDHAGAWFHAAIGMSILFLAIWRFAIRLARGAPEPADTGPILAFLGRATHLLLYGFLVFMPVTGALAWFTGMELAAIAHELGRLVLIPAILLHIAGALVEEFVLDNRVMRKMTRGSKG